MATTKDSLRVKQFIRGERNKVFQAWTDAETVRKWLCPEECRVVANRATVGVGGEYRESMKCGEDIYTVFGTYRQIIPDRKLVFTHQWEERAPRETEVEVDFMDKGDGCEITLIQKGFANAATAKGHEKGWMSSLRNLARQFS